MEEARDIGTLLEDFATHRRDIMEHVRTSQEATKQAVADLLDAHSKEIEQRLRNAEEMLRSKVQSNTAGEEARPNKSPNGSRISFSLPAEEAAQTSKGPDSSPISFSLPELNPDNEAADDRSPKARPGTLSHAPLRTQHAYSVKDLLKGPEVKDKEWSETKSLRASLNKRLWF